MTNPTQNQDKNPQASNQNPKAGTPNQQDQAQGRKDDMHNTGTQAKANQPQTADKDVQQRKEAPKQDQNH
jgi:hypothetical protein